MASVSSRYSTCDGWSCPACTFLNLKGSFKCAGCNGRRGSATRAISGTLTVSEQRNFEQFIKKKKEQKAGNIKKQKDKQERPFQLLRRGTEKLLSGCSSEQHFDDAFVNWTRPHKGSRNRRYKLLATDVSPAQSNETVDTALDFAMPTKQLGQVVNDMFVTEEQETVLSERPRLYDLMAMDVCAILSRSTKFEFHNFHVENFGNETSYDPEVALVSDMFQQAAEKCKTGPEKKTVRERGSVNNLCENVYADLDGDNLNDESVFATLLPSPNSQSRFKFSLFGPSKNHYYQYPAFPGISTSAVLPIHHGAAYEGAQCMSAVFPDSMCYDANLSCESMDESMSPFYSQVPEFGTTSGNFDTSGYSMTDMRAQCDNAR